MKIIKQYKLEQLEGEKVYNVIPRMEPTVGGYAIMESWAEFWRERDVPFVFFEIQNNTKHGRYPTYIVGYKEMYVGEPRNWRQTTTIEKLMES